VKVGNVPKIVTVGNWEVGQWKIVKVVKIVQVTKTEGTKDCEGWKLEKKGQVRKFGEEKIRNRGGKRL
jgi:hypothetical protein